MVGLLLVGLVVVAFWWAVHRNYYRQGKVARPFFSKGGSRRHTPVRARARARQPTTVGSVAQMRYAVRQITPYIHNETTAARLLHSTRLAHKGKSLQWCVDKVIGDVVRDRH